MTSSELFTADHQGLYLKGEAFYPLIEEDSPLLSSWSNTVAIRLLADLNADLDWSEAELRATDVLSQGKFILWEIDLGLTSFIWKPDEVTAFNAFSIALDQFCLKIFPAFKESTLGVCLYKGKVDFPLQFPKEWWEPAFVEWQQEQEEDLPDAYEVFCSSLLSDYLHRLVSILPAEVIPFALFDVRGFQEFSQVAHLFLQERFEYVCLGLKGATGPHAGICWESGLFAQGYWGQIEPQGRIASIPTSALFLPEDLLWNASVFEKLENMITHLQLSKTSFRLISEVKLTEQWDGLDQIVVPSSLPISVQAKRKFAGFEAAGGRVIYLDTENSSILN